MGHVARIAGLSVESAGPCVPVGEICRIRGAIERLAEVVGFGDGRTYLMPFDRMEGIAPGDEVISTGSPLMIGVGQCLLGRVVDALGRPLDSKGPLACEAYVPADRPGPDPMKKERVTKPVKTGIRAIDTLITCGRGQRMGVFSGSGVGKSTMIAEIAKKSNADINIVALIGERGKELRDFIEKTLGEEGLRRSVVIAVTSDQPSILRVKGAMTATSIAEYFRDKGMSVFLLLDSLTRIAFAQREIGLAIGEPPTTRGYTPSSFAILPRLLERAGTASKGSITGFYSVLVEGDDMNEPVSDAVRAILDGHIVLKRQLATENHYPAIDILESVSRVMIDVIDPNHMKIARKILSLYSVYRNAKDLIDIGAYVKGSSSAIDEAIAKMDRINEFLKQAIGEATDMEADIKRLSLIANG
jgi:flagellum-specific ATP synthase